MSVLDAALFWHALGIAAIPIRYRDKRPLIAWNRYRERLPRERELHFWFGGRPRNLALLCGWQNLTVVDFDDRALYDLWREWASTQSSIAATIAECTYQVRTRRGVHVYISLDELPPGNLKLDGIDVKTAGGYVLAPPSVHPSGARYQALEDGAPIIRANALEDVLPESLLQPDQPKELTLQPARVAELPGDPWQAAVAPALIDGNNPGLVATAKQELDLLALLPQPIVRRGRQFWTRCPLHDDHDPSLQIKARTQRAKCWAGCTNGKWWDAIDFYAALNNMTLADAIHELGG